MPRAGLNGGDVVAAAAGLADETGYAGLTMGLLADRLGVRTPSLYKHVGGLADLQHRLATLAMTELGEVIRDAVQGRAGARRAGRAADRGPRLRRRAPGPLHGHGAAPSSAARTTRCWPRAPACIDSIAAVLRGYGIGEDEMDHAIRTIRSTIHGFAMLEASRGLPVDADPDESFDWMIRFIDRGLRGTSAP